MPEKLSTDRQARVSGKEPLSSVSRNDGFRLLHYFTVTSLIAFSVVATALFILQRMEEDFFAEVQKEQTAFFARTQSEFAQRQESLARNNMLSLHEASHVNLTMVISNTLRDVDLLPFLRLVQQIPADHCRTLPEKSGTTDKSVGTDPAKACFAEIGRRILSLPAFTTLDAKVHTTMRKSSVFKIKVFDLRGITAYSSEHNQVGEDKSDNRGWLSAVNGKPASELTHRESFSAFEGMVENRDLISSYVPMYSIQGNIMGVFEIYSDVTPFLEQIKSASAKTSEIAAANQSLVDRSSRDKQHKVNSSSDRFLAIVYGLLALLYVALLLLIRNGQRIINAQQLAHQRAVQREAQWHREKMAALAAMAANVAHEVGNPLATIAGAAEELATQQAASGGNVSAPRMILEQTRRIAQMTRQIADFAAARSEVAEPVDVNQMTKAVCDFLSFDQRFQSRRIEFRSGSDLPACLVVPDLLNEVLMNLLQLCLECSKDHPPSSGTLKVETAAHGNTVKVHINCDVPAVGDPFAQAVFQDTRFESILRRVTEMGGQLSSTGSALELILPCA